jgi:hypothetical protein
LVQIKGAQADPPGSASGKQEFRRADFGSRLLAAEGEGEGDSEVEGERCV